MIFIGDIAGQYECLMRLEAKLLPGRDILLIGDLVDRGPDSSKVVEWARTDKRVDSLYGNHEDMFIDWFLETNIYERNLWVDCNGGDRTLESYGMFHHTDECLVPGNHMDWLLTRPLFKTGDGWIATHAPIQPFIPWEVALDIHRENGPYDDSVIWNRDCPQRREDGRYQIFGHEGKLELHSDKQGEFAVCIDSSHSKCLTAMLWPEKTFIQEPFL